jgi:hypothetical protein
MHVVLFYSVCRTSDGAFRLFTLSGVLKDFEDLWRGERLGQTKTFRHLIKVDTPYAIRDHPRRFSPEELKIIDEEVLKIKAQGVIRPSRSPHTANPVLVMKKTGDWRFCIDYRRLNQHTIPDSHPLPRIMDLIRAVRDSRHFVALDLRAGYWQIAMEPDSIPYTAFRTRDGLLDDRPVDHKLDPVRGEDGPIDTRRHRQPTGSVGGGSKGSGALAAISYI